MEIARPVLATPHTTPILSTVAHHPRSPRPPLPPTRLIGREVELGLLAALLTAERPRLLTLTGPGGVGKTRLALRVAEDVVGDFADGAAFVDRSPFRDPILVGKAIAQAIGAPQADALSTEDALSEALRRVHHLLVLDNFEQVVEAAPLLTRLLGDSPRLKLLVTSRVVLRLSGEHDFPVPALAAPDHLPASASALASFAAVQLFDTRARAVHPEFTLSAANAATVAAIVRRLDGLPLAIELAAARASALPPDALLEHLSRRLPLLTSGPHDAPGRLRTMRDAIAWSHDLLSDDEQRLFRRLAVFVGGPALRPHRRIDHSGRARHGRSGRSLPHPTGPGRASRQPTPRILPGTPDLATMTGLPPAA